MRTIPPRAAASQIGVARIGVARIGLKKLAVPRRALGLTTSRPDPQSKRVEQRVGNAKSCDLALWSRGLYGVLLPERRETQRPIAFADRRS